MTKEHPITPPSELVEKWYEAIDNSSTSWKQELTTMTDYKQLCAELLRAMDEIEECEAVDWSLVKTKPLKMANQSMAEARAALAESDGPAVPESREPASVTDHITHQLHRRATILLIRKVIDQAICDTASVHWRVADTGEQLVRASDLVAWADHMEQQMEQLID